MLRLGVLLSLLVSISCSRIDLDQDWERFKSQHQKAYISDVDAANSNHGSYVWAGFRRALWEDNVGVIESHNLEADLGQHTYRLGQNRYTDMSHEEFLQLMTGHKQMGIRDDPSPVVLNASSTDLPDTVDWREDGYVTNVKDQGECGSCWAFSAACSLEGQHYRKTGRLVSLSEQNLVDCARNGNYGCEGGYIELAFDYIRQNKGIDTEESYPYVAKQKDCNFSQENVGATDAGFAVVISESEDALKSAVALEGPISVAIDASSRSFMLYKSGIFSSSKCSSKKLNHAVTVVGYGAQKKQEYWLLKNSWSTTWGEDGYVFMARNDGNMCGVATEGILPLV